MKTIDFTRLSLLDVRRELDEIVTDAAQTFGALDARQLNWKPDAHRWSVAQCFEHLLAANDAMLRSANAALEGREPRTIWQRLPLAPTLLGRALIRSQGPAATRKFVAPAPARPATSDIAADVVARFLAQQRNIAAWMATLDEARAARTIMTSPFVRVVTYSVLDSCRLIAAHDWRHVEQARRVAVSPQFPAAPRSGVV